MDPCVVESVWPLCGIPRTFDWSYVVGLESGWHNPHFSVRSQLHHYTLLNMPLSLMMPPGSDIHPRHRDLSQIHHLPAKRDRLQAAILFHDRRSSTDYYLGDPGVRSSHDTVASEEGGVPRGNHRFLTMDEEQRQRRDFEQSTYGRDYAPVSQSRGTNEAAQMRGLAGDEGMDNLRQSHSQSARTATGPNLASGAVGSYNYAQSQQYNPQHLSGGSYQYQPVYHQQQQRQLGDYSQYGAQMSYGVSPSMPAAQAQYAQFQQRQPTASSDTLGQQFGVPQYYQQTPSTVTTSQLTPSQYSTTQFQPPAAFNPTNDLSRSTLASPYPTAEPEISHIATTEPAGIGQKPSPEQEEKPHNRFEVFNHQFQRTLRETNENTSRGRLVEAGESLLELSGLLLGNVESLGARVKSSSQERAGSDFLA